LIDEGEVRMDGRTPEEVFYDTRFLVNSRLARCSKELRDEWNLEQILYFGIGPHESHRAGNLTAFYEHNPIEPVETHFPMIETFREDLDVKAIIEQEWGELSPNYGQFNLT